MYHITQAVVIFEKYFHLIEKVKFFGFGHPALFYAQPEIIIRNLIKLGVPEQLAISVGMSFKSAVIPTADESPCANPHVGWCGAGD